MTGPKIPKPEWLPRVTIPPRVQQALQQIPAQFQHIPAYLQYLIRNKRFRVIAPAAVAGLLIVTLAVQAMIGVVPTHAATNSFVFSSTDTSRTTTIGGTFYASHSAPLTLTITLSTAAYEVDLSGGFTVSGTCSSTSKTSFVFNLTAPSGTGMQTTNISPYTNYNSAQSKCTGEHVNQFSAQYVLDNSGPTTTGSASPAANGAGWNNSAVTITLSASDPTVPNGTGTIAGSGVKNTYFSIDGAPPVQYDSTNKPQVSGNGIHLVTFYSTDNVSNQGSTGGVVLNIDTTKPTISGSASPAANTYGWNNGTVAVSFTCFDALSGVASCTPAKMLSSDGANQSASGTATDVAGNSNSTTVSGINIDTTPPTISGAPDRSPDSNGWYNKDVTVSFTCGDTLSGVANCSGPTTLGEGANQSATGNATDKAGNLASAKVGPLNVDKTAPNTTADAPSGWNNNSVTVNLTASDNLSGVANTYYVLDGGTQQTGTSVTIDSEGDHTLKFWSTDVAGNTESAKSAEVKIDKTPPTITDSKSPAPNANNWNNTSVTVTFICNDSLSGVASCTTPQTVTSEGKDQSVTGTAVDNAGNSATDKTSVSIDTTAPTITGAPDRAANANGWYNNDVTISFTCGDTLSGVANCSGPTTLGEGANQSVTGNAKDAADNTSTTTVGNINIDKTPPTLTGAASTSANGAGWYKGDVTIQWSCGDALSGIDGACPSDSTITGEGSNLSASASVSDKAGNSTNTTVDGIKIDRHAPITTASVPDPLTSGWYAGPVQVTLTGTDELSGVATTYYSVDGGAAQTYSGPFSHSMGGVHTITFWSMDNAGNVEDNTGAGNSITIKIDNVPPTITASAAPPANGNGWNNTSVTVTFTCSDAQSGIASCPGSVTLDEGQNQSGVGTAYDNAGNHADASYGPINVDRTLPTLNGAPTTSPNGQHGWYTSPVTIHWTASDALSGVDPATLPGDSVISTEGLNQTANASVSDLAGNSTSATSSPGVNLDNKAPYLTINNIGGTYTLGASIPTPMCSASDDYSGFDSSNTLALTNVPCTNAGSSPSAGSIGSYTYSATLSDWAGNSTTANAPYKVVYGWSGFLQPITDTAHSTGTMSVFKAGSTVPVKFQLLNASGQPIQAPGTLYFLTPPSNDGPISAPVDTTTTTASPTSGNAFRWDSTSQQYIYNWQTSKSQAGYAYTIYASLDDGSIYSTMIGLR